MPKYEANRGRRDDKLVVRVESGLEASQRDQPLLKETPNDLLRQLRRVRLRAGREHRLGQNHDFSPGATLEERILKAECKVIQHAFQRKILPAGKRSESFLELRAQGDSVLLLDGNLPLNILERERRDRESNAVKSRLFVYIPSKMPRKPAAITFVIIKIKLSSRRFVEQGVNLRGLSIRLRGEPFLAGLGELQQPLRMVFDDLNKIQVDRQRVRLFKSERPRVVVRLEEIEPRRHGNESFNKAIGFLLKNAAVPANLGGFGGDLKQEGAKIVDDPASLGTERDRLRNRRKFGTLPRNRQPFETFAHAAKHAENDLERVGPQVFEDHEPRDQKVERRALWGDRSRSISP